MKRTSPNGKTPARNALTRDAAAVIAGSVLEAHLRAMSAKFEIATTNDSGAPTKAETLNVGLVNAGVYNKLEQKQLRRI